MKVAGRPSASYAGARAPGAELAVYKVAAARLRGELRRRLAAPPEEGA